MPEDVHAVVHPALAHRIVLTTEADVRGVDPRTVVEGAVNSVPVPSMDRRGLERTAPFDQNAIEIDTSIDRN
ncbi:hypothetical protein [Haloterrigena gelatinilytica]|uniref:hypothetical protein n=1 Tax=Haloterrigena gelatinilytica TaxID=2741724 RepID=UPI0020C5CD9C|nr:hypothetical protein [Haloterrigena gelatinilytica]